MVNSQILSRGYIWLVHLFACDRVHSLSPVAKVIRVSKSHADNANDPDNYRVQANICIDCRIWDFWKIAPQTTTMSWFMIYCIINSSVLNPCTQTLQQFLIKHMRYVWTTIENSYISRSQKAFDTVDHEILLPKLSYFGFTEQVVNWFRSHSFSSRKYSSK